MKRAPLLLCLFALVVVPIQAQESKENADFKLAVNLFNDKLYDLALEQFKQFVSQYPTTQQSVEARFYLGLTQTKLGQYDDARLTFQNFALTYADHPRAPEAWMKVADLYVAVKNYGEAALAYERAKTFHPKSQYAPQALIKAADNFEKVGDRESVKRTLRCLVQEYSVPEVLPARLRLAQLYLDDNDLESARNECRRVLDTSKDDGLRAKAMLLMAQAQLRQSRPQDAEASLQEIIKNYRTTSSYYAALLTLGNVRKAMGNTSDAASAWRIAVDDSTICPKAVRQQALLALGQLYVEDRDLKRALQTYERAAQINAPRSGEAWYRLAVVAEQTKDVKRAADGYARAFSDTTTILDRRALIIGAFKGAGFRKDFNEAVRLSGVYEKEFPSDKLLPRILLETGCIYRDELHDYRNAERVFESIVNHFGSSNLADDALFELSLAQRMDGDYEAALNGFETLRRRFPSSSWVDNASDQILRITSFDQKDRDAGLEQLALLVGDVIAQKSKGDLAFRLAEIYFHQLKDYRQAATEYASSLNSEMDNAKRPAALFGLAKSLELSALQQEDNKVDASATQAQAVAAYDSLLVQFPASELADQAIVSLFQLRLKREPSPTQIRKLSTDFLSTYPNAHQKDIVLLAIANSLLSSKNYEDAALTFKLVKEQYAQQESGAEAQFKYGECLMSMGDEDSAFVVLSQFLASNPNTQFSARAAWILAGVATEKGDEASALIYLSVLEKQYYYSDLAVGIEMKRGDAAFNAKNFGAAIVAYLNGMKAHSEDFFAVDDIERNVLYNLAVSYRTTGKLAEAKKYFAAYLSRSGSSEKAGDVYLALAAIAKDEKNLDLAAAYLQDAGQYQKEGGAKAIAVSLEAAELFYKNEQYTDALTRFSEAAQYTKDTTQLQYLESRIVVCYFRLDNTKEAERRVAAFEKSYPNAKAYAAEFEFERGRYLIRKDETAKAKEAFDALRRKFPHAPIVGDAMYWTARIFELDEKPQEAIKMYDSLLIAFPQSAIAPRARLALGNVYYNLEKWDEAAKNFKAILDSESRSPDLVQYAMNNLILTDKELGLFDGALDLTRKYIERYPNDPDLMDKRIDIGVLYQKLGYYDQSVLQLQSLLENSNPDLEAELRYYIGEAYFYKGDYQQAILEFLKVPYLVTKRGKVDWISTSYYMAGQSYEKMSKYDQAMTMYKQIIERKDTEAQFKTAAQKEIDRVKAIVGK